jgi:hypothetical protein
MRTLLCFLAGFAGIAYAVIDEAGEYRGRLLRANGENHRPFTTDEQSLDIKGGGKIHGEEYF